MTRKVAKFDGRAEFSHLLPKKIDIFTLSFYTLSQKLFWIASAYPILSISHPFFDPFFHISSSKYINPKLFLDNCSNFYRILDRFISSSNSFPFLLDLSMAWRRSKTFVRRAIKRILNLKWTKKKERIFNLTFSSWNWGVKDHFFASWVFDAFFHCQIFDVVRQPAKDQKSFKTIQNEPKMVQKWGKKMVQKWSKSGQKMLKKCSKNGSRKYLTTWFMGIFQFFFHSSWICTKMREFHATTVNLGTRDW